MIRRRLLAVLLVAGIGVGVVYFATDVDLPLIGGGPSKEDETGPPTLANATTDAKSGITIGWPDGWTQSQARTNAISLASEDKTVAVLVSAPVLAKGDTVIYRDTLKAIRRNYKKPRVQRVRARRIDRYPITRGALVSGQNKQGVPLRTLLLVAKGKRVAYVIEVTSARNAPQRRLVEAQTILASLKLTK